MTQKRFSKFHLVLIGPVGGVELHHGEFWVVTRINAFIAEVSIYFEYAFKAANHQTLQIKFRRNAQVHFSIQRIMVRDEGTCIGAARNRMQHRRFHFQEVVGQHEIANGGNRLRTLDKALTRFCIDHQIHIAAAIAEFLILQALVLVGHRPKALGHQAE